MLDADELTSRDINDSLFDQQSLMEAELESKKQTKDYPFVIEAMSFVIPRCGASKKRRVSIDANSTPVVKLIFGALHRIVYTNFNNDEASAFDRKECHIVIPKFISFITNEGAKESGRVDILKLFETHRVNINKVKPQSVGLYFLKRSLIRIITDEDYSKLLSHSELSHLDMITKVKAAPHSDPGDLSLTGWFSQMQWLRREDVGVGHDLYSRLASPKAIINSFNVAVEVTFYEVQECKSELIRFFREANIREADIPVEKTRDSFDNNNDYVMHMRKNFECLFELLRGRYHSFEGHSPRLDRAIRIFLQTCTMPSHWSLYCNAFFENRSMNGDGALRKSKITIACSDLLLFFSIPFLRDLSRYAAREQGVVPACWAEHIFFHWIMAAQTVQASDISLLKRKNFRFLTRRDGKITHIQLDYHKGRSGTFHSTRDIKANTNLGRCLLKFISERGMDDQCLSEAWKRLSCTSRFTAQIFLFMQCELREEIESKLSAFSASTVFLDAMLSIMENGEYSHQKQVCFPAPKSLFGPSVIKTSAVHSGSDQFDPSSLVNYHSHTNSTERQSYLTDANEEWLNNCGRVTRAVMQDLTVNLFRASKSERQVFNSEYTKAASYITRKKDEVTARLKLVTGQSDGRVDDLGVISVSRASRVGDAIHMVDTPETVLKLLHYLSEVRQKYRMILKHSPDYLFLTVLPTAEWIEQLFQDRRFKSEVEGRGLYDKYSRTLPPLFSAHT
ncbi:hypothetical protein [Microbulbifer sp. HZ11]|uniref:hypothetical protein n=1 Tax=Microbulbifer sp. HZ11 TaxID=1453501 RepID=UPI0005B8D605|nr:hypothetical protein [Microbulbifer sp. HZ11]